MVMEHTLPIALNQFIQQMPKVELHLHLEGTVRPTTLLHLARRNNIELPAHNEAGVEQLFRYRNFHEFLTVFMILVKALQRGEDFELVAYELGHHLADQNVRYAEVMLSVAQYAKRGHDMDEVIQGTAAGFARARAERGVLVNLVFDYGRQSGIDLAWRTLEAAIRNKPYSVVGWSIGGDEVNYPPELFAEVYAAARTAGLQTMAHAGEVVGPKSIWGAIDVLEVERIGHGIRSIDDPALVAALRDRGITLDISPSSNVCTGAVRDLGQHPMRYLFDAGVPVTLNTDDPTFFHTTLNNEFGLAVKHFGFTSDDLCQLTLNAARAAFLPAAERGALVARIDQELRHVRHNTW